MQATLCPFCMKTAEADCCPHCGRDVRYPGYPGHLPVGYTLQGSSIYILGAYIGQGGFGITYIALDMTTNQRVAIKEYYPSHCCIRNNATHVYPSAGQEETYAKGKQHFLREAQMLQSLSDLNSVVKVLDYFEANNSAYLVMEYLDGPSLKDHVEKNGKLPAQQFLHQMKPLMADMEKMHRRGVVHRDIAPDNIILLPDGRLKLIDFGAARSYVGDKSMTVVVKKGFAPVEQYMRKGSNASTDVYALAATIYYCITGIIPPDSAERQYGEAELVAPTAMGVELSPQQERGLEQALEIQPKKRLQSVAELMTELEHLPKSMLQKQEEERRQQERLHKKQQEEERHQQERLRKKQEEEQRRQEALQKKQEEDRHRQEQLRKKQEEEQRRQELLRKKQEEEQRRQEQLRQKREEERHRQEELRKKREEDRHQKEQLRQKREDERRQREELRKKQKERPEQHEKTKNGKSAKRYALIAAAAAVILAGILLIMPRDNVSLSTQETEATVTEATVSVEVQSVQELSEEAQRYNEAVDFFENKEYGKAAIAFGKLGDYRDAKQISRKIWDAITVDKTIAVGYRHTVAVKNDGTVLAQGSDHGNVRNWKDIAAIAAGNQHIVGLKNDGTVLATGLNDKGQCDVQNWTNIIDIAACENFTVGLKSDGTVAFTGAAPAALEKWEDIVAVACERDYAVGLKSDGTPVLSYGYGALRENIIAVGAGSSYVAYLTAEESVALPNGKKITDVDRLFVGSNITVVIQKDGTVISHVAFTSDSIPESLDDWEELKNADIVAFDASAWHAVLLKKDGTISGYGDNQWGQCDVSNWKDIRLPKDRDAMLAKIKLKYVHSEAHDYNEAVGLFKNGEYGKAAIAFAKLGDYRDAQEISSKIWSAITDQNIIHAGYGYAAAVSANGTIMTAGEAKFDDSEVHNWKDIVAVKSVMGELAGLKSDGSVVGTGSWIEENYSFWNNIVSMPAEHVLCSNGTFATSWLQIRDCYSWLFEAEDIISVQCANFASGDGAILKADGTVEAWKVSSDGKDLVPVEEVSDWVNIVSIDYRPAGSLFGVSADGKVYSARTSRHAGTFMTDDWTDIVSITNCGSYVLGLKSDGTVVAAGQTEGEHFEEESWSDIAAIYQTAGNTIGLKSDGTVVITGVEDGCIKDMRNWTNIKVPVRRDDLLASIQLEYITDSGDDTPTQPDAEKKPAADISENILMGLGISEEERRQIGGGDHTVDPISKLPLFNTAAKRKYVRSITFWDTLKHAPVDAADASALGNGKVKAWVEKKGDLYDVYVAAEGGVLAPENCDQLFSSMPNLFLIEFGDAFDTSKVTTMGGMFEYCTNLKTLNLRNFDTSNVKYMGGMFYHCSKLESVNVQSFDTSKVTSMQCMFGMCKNLVNVDLSGFDTSNVTSTTCMFLQCNALKDLDLSSFDMSNVTDAFNMFYKCPAERPEWYNYTMD